MNVEGELAHRKAVFPYASIRQGEEPEVFIYKEINGSALKLLMLRPDKWSSGDRRTAVVWIHGGGWGSGDPEVFIPHCRYLSRRGAVAFSVQYRLTNADSGVGVADCLMDCRAAIRYIREQSARFGIDPARIVVAGDSAGGHLAACLGTSIGAEEADTEDEYSRVNAVIICNGIVDMTMKWRDVLQAVGALPAGKESEAIQEWFAIREQARQLSPLYHVHSGLPPVLIMHGLQDQTVSPEQSVRYYEAQLACGNTATLVLFPQSKHAFVLFDYTAAVEETMLALGEIDAFLVDNKFLEIQQ